MKRRGLFAVLLSAALWTSGYLYGRKGLLGRQQLQTTIISTIDTRLPCPDKLGIHLASSATCTIEFVHDGSLGRLVMRI